MRIYANFTEAAKEIERDLWELGANVTTRSMQDRVGEFPAKELMGYQFSVPCGPMSPVDEDNLTTFMGIDSDTFQRYIGRENEERWIGTGNPGTSWEVRREEWKHYLHEGKFAYTYPERIWNPTNQLGHCISVLKNDPFSRQAIVQVYDKHRDFTSTGGRARIPCSLTYQFLRRDSDVEPKLHTIYTMRSCDFYRHWAYDMVLATRLNVGMARSQLNWQPGNLIMQMGSLHAYNEDLEKRKIF